MLQEVFKLGEFRVICIRDMFPLMPHIIQQLLVFSQQVYVFWLEMLSLEGGVLGVLFCLLVQFLFNFLLRISLFDKSIDVHIRGNDNLIILPHVNEILIGILEVFKRYLECIKTTFQTLHQTVLADACQAAADGLCIVVKSWGSIRLQIGNGLIASIGKLLIQNIHRLYEESGHVVVQFILLFDGVCHLGELLHIFAIAGNALNVRSGTTNCDRLNHRLSHLLRELLEFSNIEIRILSEFLE